MASSSRFTLLPPSYLASQSPESETTLPLLLATSDNLAADAKEALPYAFDTCTYSQGYLRQSVWSCLDCGEKGVCYGCSITCHGDHRLVELWTKRHFRCDCPTSAMSDDPDSSSSNGTVYSRQKRCKLNPPDTQPRELNSENRYGKTFQGVFCRCGRDYDPETETEAMVVCIGCEDWFHESCLNLSSTEIPVDNDDDDEDEHALIPSDTYDGLLCADCVQSSLFMKQQAGKEGYMIIEPDGDGAWRVVGRETKTEAVETEGDGEALGEAGTTVLDVNEKKNPLKRPSEEEGRHSEKRRRGQDDLDADVKDDQDPIKRQGRGDIFLAHGIRERLRKTIPEDIITSLPFPLVDEEIYEPPKDEDSEETIDQVTERVVGALPRVQAIEALHGYQNMKDRLRTMLAAHVVSGQTVSKEDIERVFSELRASTQR